MKTMSEVGILVAQRTVDLEAARDQFCSDLKQFVGDLFDALKKMPSEKLVSRRLRLDQFIGPEHELKASSTFRNKRSTAALDVRFKREMKTTSVAQLAFCVQFDEDVGQFCWQVILTPGDRYDRVDDRLWAEWRKEPHANSLPGGKHLSMTNEVQFVSRPVTAELTEEVALGDLKTVIAFVLGADAVVAEAIGADVAPKEVRAPA